MLRYCFVVALVALSGCGKPTSPPSIQAEVDPHDVSITEADFKLPATYAAAIPQIKSYRDTIRGEIEAGTSPNAHRSLDELDIVLNKLPMIAKESGIPKEQWETVNTAAQELRNLFDQVHSAIDDKREPDFKVVAEPIDLAIAKLEQVQP